MSTNSETRFTFNVSKKQAATTFEFGALGGMGGIITAAITMLIP